jgi:serine protease Do
MPRSPRPTLAVLLLVAVLAVAVPAAPAQETTYWREDVAVVPAPELARFNQLLGDLAEQLKPALVHVRVRRAPGQEREEDSRTEPRRSTGSGFIIASDGLIVTNAHVVQDADWVQVRLADGRRFTGKVIGEDARVDLALIRVDGASGLPTLPIGDSNGVRVGESFGIVSRKGAPLTVAAPGFDFIQTDAAINPGNSGGPLVNMAGQVVGVNSMAARNGSIGFAIPSNLVKLLVPQLVVKGRVEWGWLGVSITEVGEDDLERLKLREARGVLVRGVLPGEPAAQGGVQADDVIIALDGTPLAAPRDLQRVVSTTPVGKRVRVVVLRGGEQKEMEVTIGLYKDRASRGTPDRPDERPRPAP